MKHIYLNPSQSNIDFKLKPVHMENLSILINHLKKRKHNDNVFINDNNFNIELELGTFLTYYCLELCYLSQKEFNDYLPVNVKDMIVKEILVGTNEDFPLSTIFSNKVKRNIELHLNMPEGIVDVAIEYNERLINEYKRKSDEDYFMLMNLGG